MTMCDERLAVNRRNLNETTPRFNGVFIGMIAFGLMVPLASRISFGQDYASSVVATDFDFITDEDPSCFMCLEFKFRGFREMPDKTGPSPLVQKAFVFVAYYEDGTFIDIALDAEFGDPAVARKEAMRYATRLGKLPTILRLGVERIVVHKGHRNTTAFGGDGLITLYSDNATKRISTHDLEETLFHESVHAAWDNKHSQSEGWLRAQAADGNFVTTYAKKKPQAEDLAETALFAYTMIHHPERLPEKVRQKIATQIPARIRFIEKLVPQDQPVIYSRGPKYACDGSGETFVVEQERFENSLAEFKKQTGKSTVDSSKGRTGVEDSVQQQDQSVCRVNLALPGHMKDIISNALMRGLGVEESKVQTFLLGAEKRFETGDALLAAAAKHFQIEKSELADQVAVFHHVNCSHKELNPSESTLNSRKRSP